MSGVSLVVAAAVGCRGGGERRTRLVCPLCCDGRFLQAPVTTVSLPWAPRTARAHNYSELKCAPSTRLRGQLSGVQDPEKPGARPATAWPLRAPSALHQANGRDAAWPDQVPGLGARWGPLSLTPVLGHGQPTPRALTGHEARAESTGPRCPSEPNGRPSPAGRGTRAH